MLFSSFFSGLSDPDRKFNRIMSSAWDMIYLNILFVLSHLPIITGGAGSAALYYACSKVLLHHRSYISKEFFRSWRQNLRQGIFVHLIFLLLLGLVGLDFYYALTFQSVLRYVYMAIGITVVSLLLSTYIYAYPLMSRITMSVRDYLGMSLKIACQHLFPTIPLLLLLLVFIFLTVYIPPFILITPSLFCRISCPWIEKVLKQHIDYDCAKQTADEDPWYTE